MKINDFNNILEGLPAERTINVIANIDASELKMPEDTDIAEREIPILPLRTMVLFPHTLLPVNAGRKSSRNLLKDMEKNHDTFAVFGQKNERENNPGAEGLYEMGVLAKVVKLLELPDGSQTAFLQGFSRVSLVEVHEGSRYLMGKVAPAPEQEPKKGDKVYRATVEACKDLAEKYMQKQDGNKIEPSFALKDVESCVSFINFLSATLPIPNNEQAELLALSDQHERALKLLEILNREYQYAQLKANIQMQTHAELSQQQREFFLKRELENIKDELGDEGEDDIEKLRARASKMKWSEAVGEKFEKELIRLSHQPSQSPEYAALYDYLDTLLQLPWNEYTNDQLDLKAAERILNRDHYGMEKVKERILEHLAVLKLRGDMKSPILCLYGPPGVGKTSLGKSIAKAMKRQYVRVSLGGLHDESEIRGHRRTYIGAMPGRIIKAMLDAKTSNPVFILDEIDKVSSNDFHGDPSSALLEVLDPEQNGAFHDNYIDIDFDLSKVMFIATANNIGNIPAPLLDRMELIEVSGYLTEEKIEIAKRHLIPKNAEALGLDKKSVTFIKRGIEKIIEDYTRESGVRELDKKLAKVMRKIALQQAREETAAGSTKVDAADVPTYLGTEIFSREHYQNNDYCGVVTGLAWTAVGGEILFVETSLSQGKGSKLTLTGNLGDVMKESATIALEYVKAHADALGINPQFFEEWNIHIHVPEGAVPKDGPSAGITIATSIASAITHRKVRKNLAMTGEITLRGKVMPVGGIKEKILAAKRAGITEIILCEENKKNIDDIPAQYIKGLTFHYVKDVQEVLQYALL